MYHSFFQPGMSPGGYGPGGPPPGGPPGGPGDGPPPGMYDMIKGGPPGPPGPPGPGMGGEFLPGMLMSMLMTIFSNSSFCDKKVACSIMLKYD